MDTPDFAALFPVCHCRSDNCDRCTGLQLTPRTAYALQEAAETLEDLAHLDVRNNGSAPVTEHGEWHLFDRYPRATWSQDQHWRHQAARAYTDLRRDLTAGTRPEPRCPAEEMALNLIVEEAQDAIREASPLVANEQMRQLPAHPDDFDEGMLEENLLQDTDILMLFSPRLDGIDHPEGLANRQLRMGDYRPQAWFTVSNNMPPRRPDTDGTSTPAATS